MSASNFDIFENCRNLYGKISDDQKNAIISYLKSPSQKQWDEIHCYILGADGWTTLWQGVIAINPHFSRSKPLKGEWSEIPSIEDVHEALFYLNELG